MHDEYPPGSHEWAFGKLDPETKKRLMSLFTRAATYSRLYKNPCNSYRE